eukprot:GEMP01018230.1.p1 GENE.GEMP01018230.1~~GEMP01018230.1.p1  ORF type:complete len:346 (+),score=58.27 GEMP01018230.1:131-1039(+)
MDLPGQVPEIPDNSATQQADGNGKRMPRLPGGPRMDAEGERFDEVKSKSAKAARDKRRRKHIVETNVFQLIVAFVILFNAISIGIETDYGCHGVCTVSQRGIWYSIECIFAALFTIEMLMRFNALGVCGYFMNKWNRFDFVLVVSALLDTGILSHISIGIHLNIFTIWRIIRLFRLARLIRFVRMFRELYLIINGMVDALKAVGYVFLVMLLLLWCGAIFMTIMVGHDSDPRGYNYDQVPWTREQYWGTVSRSLFSLFQLMTADAWVSSLAAPVLAKYSYMIFFFAFMVIYYLKGDNKKSVS